MIWFVGDDVEVISDGLSDYHSKDDGGQDSSSDSDMRTYGPTPKAFDPTK